MLTLYTRIVVALTAFNIISKILALLSEDFPLTEEKATASAKMPPTGFKGPECPVCLDNMVAPIYLCKAGHSICSNCTRKLYAPSCPICREYMTPNRNWSLEEMLEKIKLQQKKGKKPPPMPCPNKSAGCLYSLPQEKMQKHIKECPFRQIKCPLKEAFSDCAWSGLIKDAMQHCQECHKDNCLASTGHNNELTMANIKQDMVKVFATATEKFLFIVTIKNDTANKMSYWAIQHIGSAKMAQQHYYEIKLTSNVDPNRTVAFSEYCYSDSMTTGEIFSTGKCAVLPLVALANFINDQKLNFQFTIKRSPPQNNNNDNNNSERNIARKPFRKGFKHPTPNRSTRAQ